MIRFNRPIAARVTTRVTARVTTRVTTREQPSRSSQISISSRRSRRLLSSFFFVLLAISIAGTVGGQQSQEPQCKPQEPTKYDWERYNYYELLGLNDEDEKSNKKKKKKKKQKTGQDKDKNKNKGKGKGKNTTTTTSATNSNGEEGNGISAKEIRKAYRKQAQKFHPDKQGNKKKSSSSSDNDNDNDNDDAVLSKEESTARFAKIAEAYEFLLDDTKRKDYDLFLEYCHNTEILKDDDVHEGRLSTMLKKRFHGLFDDLVGTKDPFKVFKDVFFGSDNDGNNDGNNNVYFDPDDPFSHLRYENNPQRHPNHRQYHQNEEPYTPNEDPLRVFHDKNFMYDPMTGENVIRVLQTEEHPPSSSSSTSSTSTSTRKGSTRAAGNSTSSSSSSSSSFYYRIVAQDFEERYDPFTAKKVYVPITEPYLQEEGFRTVSASKDQQKQAASESSSSESNNQHLESILHSWEVLTPGSPPMVSPNKRYIAGLSADCELLVMINPERFGDENDGYGYGSSNYDPPEILWSTQRPYGKNGYASENCFALLKGPHLVVTVGQHPRHSSSSSGSNNRILWHSDSRNDEDDSRHGYYEYEDEFGFWHKRQRSYLAQLDNDGSLTVYSVWSVPEDSSEDRFNSHHGHNQNQHHHHQQQQSPVDQHRVRVSNAARAAKDFWHGRIPTHHEYDHLYSTSRSLTYKRCVYSTHGTNLPLGIGCYRISRKLHQAALEATLAVRKLVFQMNHFADAWLDLIYEEDDIFFLLKESIRKNSNTLGSKMAGSSAKWVRKVLEGIRKLKNAKQSQSQQ